jgi:protein-L-isoaspartate(D-aspartate) O-methyltransferase
MRATDFSNLRANMVERQIAARGIKSHLVLAAMREVPREDFLPEDEHEFAYFDTPLPIADNQTISQPYIVALMIEALELTGGEKVLEIGTGSGYAAAVLSRIARDVYTVERLGSLAEKAAVTLVDHGYENVHVLQGDGTRGWPEHAPYDAIIVAAGGPDVPQSLKSQLKVGGRLVIPVGPTPSLQELVRITRVSADEYRTEDLADVRFVPLVGVEGWSTEEARSPLPTLRPKTPQPGEAELVSEIARHCERFVHIESADLEPMMNRIGDARVVLLGESTHGTSEFYRMRERITRALIETKGFTFIAIEGDWPDAARIDHYVRHAEYPQSEWTAFARFPTWMWRNREVRTFVDWLRERNTHIPPQRRTAFYGLDLYSLHTSIRSVVDYLENVSWTRYKTRASSQAPKTIIASCIMDLAHPGTCATAICSTR